MQEYPSTSRRSRSDCYALEEPLTVEADGLGIQKLPYAEPLSSPIGLVANGSWRLPPVQTHDDESAS